jgi:hypothetical protein
MQRFEVGQRGRSVLVILNRQLSAAFHHGAARELARALRVAAEAATRAPGQEFPPQSISSGRFRVTVRYDGSDLLLVFEPCGWLIKWPPAEYSKISDALHAKAGLAEEFDEALRIAREHAILLRAGFPMGLTSNPLIQAEAKTIAEHDRDLRRFMPGGVRSQVMLGAPIVRMEERDPMSRAREALKTMRPHERGAFVSALKGLQ